MAKRSGKVTMQDVADLAGVTARTVSNVVNDYPLVKDSTRKKVWEAIGALGYTMNVSARGLKQGSTGIITLAVPDLTMPFFADLADAVIAQADQRGIYVLVEPIGSSRRSGRVVQGVRANIADGMLYCPLEINSQELTAMNDMMPTVVLSEPYLDTDHDYVSLRNRQAAKAAVALMIRGGSKRIAAVGLGAGQTRSSAEERYAGYREALREAGIQRHNELEIRTDSWHRSDGVQAISGLIDRGIRFDGVFAFTDQVAAGVLYELQMRGMKVPQDVAVVGFDNNDEAQYLAPTLTTIAPGLDELAHKGLDRLLERIGARDELDPLIQHVDFELVERESTRKV